MPDKPSLPPTLPQPELTRTLPRIVSRAKLAVGVGALITLGALGHAALYFLLAGPVGSADRKYRVGHGGPFGGMAITYLVLAIICLYPTLKLIGFLSAINRWIRSESMEDLAEVTRRKQDLASQLKIPILMIALILWQIFFG